MTEKQSVTNAELDPLAMKTMEFREKALSTIADMILPVMQACAGLDKNDMEHAEECARKSIAFLLAIAKHSEELAGQWAELFGFKVEIQKIRHKKTGESN